MRPTLVILATVLAGSPSGPVLAACVPASPAAIACLNPDAAAAAYRIVGADAKALERDNVRAVLTRLGCTRLTSVADPGKPILQFGRGRIPDLDGWVEIVAVTVESSRVGGSSVYVAKNWLSGECEPFKSVGE